ncbi:hypothetical protein [Actinopolymorpha alba]|uniref:hypothetical protein n=1 Tax=Actinopolymorpha alba TaxID=533267 RepID=UPI00035E8DBE|nr:hypothetical protein [Actinopolymorpha alba]
MKLTHAAIAVLTAVVTGVGGGAAAAQATNDHRETGAQSLPSTAQTPQDALSEENVIRERLYFDVTGHSFTRVDPDQAQTLGPCTGETTFTDVLPRRGVKRIGSKLVGVDGPYVVEQLAQTRSTREARATADEIVSLVNECAAVAGGDFGYGDPVTVQSNSSREVVYFPAYDSDAAAGGYVVFSVGARVGVIDVADDVSTAQVAHLAKEAANVAGM